MLKKLERPSLKKLSLGITKPPLGFIEPADDPIRRVPKDLTPEEQFKQTMNALGQGLSGALQKQAAQHKERGKTDYYIVVCFEHGTQADAFMRATGYQDYEAQFVDGTILAKLLKIELPPAPYRPPRLRKPDQSLARLVTVIPKRVR
jgi:hypothetical protein